ncbi:MAG: copper amine oxidase N-terminal domain-containing protein [Caldisericales bacterium]|nr:copper amine oxidase N-terminal domain-containing protein [Caldisericales bacterium]
MKKLTAFLLCALVIMPCFQTALSQDDKLIELSPKEINIVAKQGDMATATMGIFNRGSSSLLFSLSKSYSKAKTQPLASPDGNMLVYPSFLDFGTVPPKGEVSQTVTCTAPTEQYLQVTASSDVEWIKCLIRNIDKTVVSVTVTVKLDGMVTGQLYRGNVILASNAGLVQVPVILQVATTTVKDWLSYNPTNGIVSPGNNTGIQIKASAKGLPPGDQFATIIVTSNDEKQPVIEVPVKLTVIAGSPAPSTPEIFVGYPGDGRAHLFWKPIASPNVVGYYIFRSNNPGIYTDVAITDFYVTGTQYTDPNVTNGLIYYYTIKSIDQNGNLSDASNEIMVMPNPIKPVVNLKDGLVTRTQVLDVTGVAEPNSQIIVNGELAIIDPDGKFQAKTVLRVGSNTITVIVFDPGGNQTKFTYKVSFSAYTTVILMVGSKNAWVNGEEKKNALPQAPVIISGKTFVPFRFLGESLGADIGWDDQTKKVTYTLEGKKVEMWIGKTTASVDGKPVSVNPPPQVIGGSTFVPTRFITEALGASIEWKAATKTVVITYPAKP